MILKEAREVSYANREPTEFVTSYVRKARWGEYDVPTLPYLRGQARSSGTCGIVDRYTHGIQMICITLL